MNFAFSASGDLYMANCGAYASIIVYPTSTKPFTSRLVPSVNYQNYELLASRCAWGIVIH
jgi:hypothetical protein